MEKYKYVVCSTQYPSYGGCSTVTYSFIKYLISNKCKVSGLFFNKSLVNIDPDNIGGIFLVKFKYSSYDRFFKNKTDDFSQDKINNILENVNSYLESEPDVIICVGNHVSTFIKYFYPNKKIIMFTCGIIYKKFMTSNDSFNLLLDKICNDEEIKKSSSAMQENMDIKNSDIIVPNSDIMIYAYNKIYPIFKDKIYQKYFDTSNLISVVNTYNYTETVKDIDIIIISSRLDRIEKNNLFLIPILEKETNDKYVKCFIGNNNTQFVHIKNSIFTDLIPHNEIYSYLSRSKLLILPSLYESASNVIREALHCKCLILTSNNVGFNSLYPDISICTSFDHSLWENKMIYLIDNYNDIIKNYNIKYEDSCSLNDILKEINL